MQTAMPEEEQTSAMPSMPPHANLPRPWSEPLQDVLNQYYNTESFEDAMHLLISEYNKNYPAQDRRAEHQEPQVQFVTPETPSTLGKWHLSSSDKVSSSSQNSRINNRDHTPPSKKQKRRKYTPQEKQEVNETRKRRACPKCHNSHKKVNICGRQR
jgi:hypothetical protein